MEENMPKEVPQPNPEQFHILENPDFNAGNFVMYLAPDTTGFEIVTDKSMPRKDFELPLNSDGRNKLQSSMSSELRFTGAQPAKDALDKLRNANDNNRTELANDFEEKRQQYVDRGNKPKVGLRNIRKSGRKLTVDIKPVSFPVYTNFSKTENSANQRNFSEAAATCMSIITADNKLLIQHRGETNELYGDMPGASIAGMFDGTFHRPDSNKLHTEKKGTLEPITADSVLTNIKKESQEEMGIKEGDFSQITLSGLCEEIKPQPHHEFLFSAKTKLTANEIKQQALNTTRARKKDLKPEDIEEKFEFIDATPEAIFKLLTEVKCPLPPTHTAVFAATAYDLMLKRDGKNVADAFKTKLERGIKENYETMDQIVKEFYQKNPSPDIPKRMMDKIEANIKSFREKNPAANEQQISQLRQRLIQNLPHRNPNRYTPAYLPKEQGLPEFEEALKKAELI